VRRKGKEIVHVDEYLEIVRSQPLVWSVLIFWALQPVLDADKLRAISPAILLSVPAWRAACGQSVRVISNPASLFNGPQHGPVQF
jgi:hypothetical protein